jgi:two-component system, NarL family, nitrate/nitrite response regulator NarL
VSVPYAPVIRIFIADNYQTVLWGFTKLIQGEYPHMQLVGTARDASATLKGVAENLPDVLILDDELVDIDCLDFLPQLTALGHLRILILTSQQHSPNFTRDALANGADDVLSKDAPASLLLNAIESVYQAGRLQSRQLN